MADERLYLNLSVNTIMAKLTNHIQWARHSITDRQTLFT